MYVCSYFLQRAMDLNFSWVFSNSEAYVLGLLVLIWILEIVYQFYFFARPARFYKKCEKGKTVYSNQYPPISVIVYAQNDAENLIKFLPEILKQDYPQFEVIVVNDDSTDDSKDILSVLETQYSNLYHTYIPEGSRNLSHKKLALTLGVKAAQYDIVAFTNANCRPAGDQWLTSIARNFVPETDIVLGYTATQRKEKEPLSFWYCSYDKLLFTLRYLSFALIRRPYMGESSNMAYRKELFFKNKGFSKSLHLHYGDDDLFINEIANRKNTRVEISQAAQMTATYPDNNEAWKELKLQYDFTSKYLHTAARKIFGIGKFFDYAFDILFVVSTIWGILHNCTILILAWCLAIALFSIKVSVYRTAAQIFHSPKLFFALPLFSLIQPGVNIYFKIIGLASRKKNFTWQ